MFCFDGSDRSSVIKSLVDRFKYKDIHLYFFVLEK